MAKKTSVVTFKMSKELDHAVQKRVVEEGYGFNGKSKWVCQSIVKFLSFHDKEFVIESISNAGFVKDKEKLCSARITPEIESLIDEWVVHCRMSDPTLEGLRSKIVRASIVNGLDRTIELFNKLGEAKILDSENNN